MTWDEIKNQPVGTFLITEDELYVYRKHDGDYWYDLEDRDLYHEYSMKKLVERSVMEGRFWLY